MSTIPISLTEKQFDEHIRPYITVAKRGYECKIPLLQGVQLHSLPTPYRLSVVSTAN